MMLSSVVGSATVSRMTMTRLPVALAILRERGWCQGAWVSDGVPCLLAAIYLASDPSTWQLNDQIDDETAVRDVLEAQYATRKIPQFNDNPSTTFEMVEAVLEKAILNRGGSL